MARFNNAVEFSIDGHGRKTVIIEGVDYGHLRFYRVGNELVAVKCHRFGLFPAAMSSVLSEEIVTLKAAEEKFRDINRHLMVSFENGAEREETIFLFGDSNVANVAAAISVAVGKARVESSTRVLGLYVNGECRAHRSLRDFYDEVPADVLEATRF